ncbi:MAG: putative metal-dependent phosphoesterase TrpH [Desulforhopalus sp.]|jgi:predicted metal-dependent phosphoesterase TrpH
MSIDLHTHSTMSDGTMSPGDLVDLAYKKGLSCIAITDHDTASGYQEASNRGDKVGLDVISGLELSVSFGETHVHLLGYLFDCEDDNLLKCLHKLQGARNKRNSEILEKLKLQGCPISEQELKKVSGLGQTGRPHIAKILLQRGVVRSMDEAFEKYLGKSGSAYVNRFVYDIKKGIEIIHGAGGLAVVAHPYNLLKDDMESGQLLQELKTFGLDGVEAYYPTHSRKFRKQLVALAGRYDLLVTGGSDYHGAIRKGTTLAGGKGVSVPNELVEVMRRKSSEYKSVS